MKANSSGVRSSAGISATVISTGSISSLRFSLNADSRKANFESFRLGVVEEAANAFLELDRARAVLDIQQRNRELTARNLETSRARIAAGWSSER